MANCSMQQVEYVYYMHQHNVPLQPLGQVTDMSEQGGRYAQTWTVPKSMLGSCRFNPKSTPLVPSLRHPEFGPPVLM